MKILTYSLLIGFALTFFAAEPGHAQIELEVAFANLSFSRPVELQHPGDGSNRLFIVEQQGVIYRIENNRDTSTKTLFLDIQDRVDDAGNEEGLLGLAFHPDYKNNGYFYVDYTASNPDRTVIARYSISDSDSNRADKSSEFVILEVDQPYSNHNAGKILFGADGYLYITLGDGGSGGDPQGNGQNLNTLLGSILRIDVDTRQGNLNYAIPPDNPFVGNLRGFREEIYAYGLRNPWRVSFDPQTGWLWCGDVGQNNYEEIDIIKKGNNYGWNIMEGFHCYNASSCDTTGLTMPIWEYDHSVGQSITGGHVYRGFSVPELTGNYIYADYVSGRVWALQYDGESEQVNTLLKDTNLFIVSFGVDQNRELYICAFDGKIYRFKKTATEIKSTQSKPVGFQLWQNYPNPFNRSTVIRYDVNNKTHVDLEIVDLNGRRLATLVDEIKPEGQYTAAWTGRDANNNIVAGGVYLYRLKAGRVMETKKMLLLK